jgi:fructose-specific phosphotransferase system IIC component
MANNQPAVANLKYIFGVSAITFLLPVISAFIEIATNNSQSFSAELIGKWFIFYAVGLRLLLAGIKQTTNPAFTAKQIFHIEGTESFPILRELGFANLCFGLVGLISLFMPQWRVVSAFASGLYYGFAAVGHLLQRSKGANEKFALVTDVIIFILLAVYFIKEV